MKILPLLFIPLLFATACSNEYADSPKRWEITRPVRHVTPTPSPGNPYVSPEKVVHISAEDQAL